MFEQCDLCKLVWPTRGEFLADPDVVLVGYQVNFCDLLTGHFAFKHSCGSSFAICAVEFPDLYDGPIFERRLTGSDECPGYCLREHDLRPCPAMCECAYVRDVVRVIKKWPKYAS